jgi:hypothetical protein
MMVGLSSALLHFEPLSRSRSELSEQRLAFPILCCRIRKGALPVNILERRGNQSQGPFLHSQAVHRWTRFAGFWSCLEVRAQFARDVRVDRTE